MECGNCGRKIKVIGDDGFSCNFCNDKTYCIACFKYKKEGTCTFLEYECKSCPNDGSGKILLLFHNEKIYMDCLKDDLMNTMNIK